MRLKTLFVISIICLVTVPQVYSSTIHRQKRGIFSQIQQKFENFGKTISDFSAPLVDKTTDFGRNIGETAKGLIVQADGLFTEVKDGASKGFTQVKKTASKTADKMKTGLQHAQDEIKKIAKKAESKAIELGGTISDGVKKTATTVKDKAGEALDKAKIGIQSAAGKASDTVVKETQPSIQNFLKQASVTGAKIIDAPGSFLKTFLGL